MKEEIDILADELESLLLEEAKKYEGLPLALSGGVDSSLLAALTKPAFVVSVRLPGGDKHNEIQYSSLVAEHLNLKHYIIELDHDKFDEYFSIAVKAIGRPIPHFNIFPLYVMYEYLKRMGVTKLILGDGPDETMFGYGRQLIMAYLYSIFAYEAFDDYQPAIDKVLPGIVESYAKLTGKKEEEIIKVFADSGEDIMRAICKVDILLMRPDMDDMSNGIAKYFGITNLRPYQDNMDIDNYMLDLPLTAKIHNVEYGKYTLRKVAERYLPHEIAWRKKKVGGPVYPVNRLKGWMKYGEFDKRLYLEAQKKILNEIYH